MSLGSLLKKVRSNLDFWDVAENKRQNAQIDEEERRRKQQQQAARQAVQRSGAPQGGPGLSVQPLQNQPSFDFSKPLVKVGSQSDFKVKVTSGPQDDSQPEQSLGQKLLNTAKKAPGFIANTAKESIKPVVNTIASPIEQVIGLTTKDPAARQAILEDATRRNPIAQSGGNLSAAATDVQNRRNPTQHLVKAGGTATNLIASALPLIGFGKRQAGEALVKAAGRSTAQNAALAGVIGGSQTAAETGDPVEAAKSAGKTAVIFGPLAGAAEFAGPLLRKAFPRLTGPKNVETRPVAPTPEEHVAIPGAKKPATPPESIELGGGMKSTNLVKVANEPKPVEVAPAPASQSTPLEAPVPKRGNVPDVTNPIALAKAETPTPAQVPAPPTQAPIADFSQAIKAPLEKAPAATPPVEAPKPPVVEPTPTQVAQEAQAGQLPTPAATDAAGNPVAVSDVEAARQLAESGAAVPRAASPVAATEDQMARQADQAAREQVAGAFKSVDEAAGDGGAYSRSVGRDGSLPTAEVNPSASDETLVDTLTALRGIPAERRSAFEATQIRNIEDELKIRQGSRGGRDEVAGEAAPRTRAQATNLVESDSARLDVQDSFKVKDPTVIEDAQRQAEVNVRGLSDEDLVARYGLEPEIKTPQEYFDTIAAVERLGRRDTDNPAAIRALTNALDGISSFASRAGRDLRMVKELFKDLPSPLKKKYLVDRIESKLGAELPDAERSKLINLIDIADNTDAQMRPIAERLVRAQRDIQLGAPVDERLVRKDIEDLNALATRHEYQQGEAFQFSQDLLGKATAGARVAQATKTAMLSSPLRRAADVVTTGLVSAGDTTANAISGLVGRALNKLPGQAGRFRETRAGDYGKLVQGNVQGLGESKQALFGDRRRVTDYLGELQRATRADANGAQRTRFGRFVGDLTETATNATKGQYSQRLRELARQDGQQLGLKGDDLKLYTEVGETIPSQTRRYEASQYHLRTNNLHDNKVSAAFRRIASTIEQMFPQGGPILNVLTVPFKSYQAGNLNRLFTDKTLIGNAFQFVKAAKRGDGQGMIDILGKAAVNTGETVALGMALSSLGLISDTNDNGEDWAGPYVKTPIGSIPVGFFGPAGLNVLMGHNLNRLSEDNNNIDDFINNVGKQAISFTNIEGSLGGGNQLQQLISGEGDFTDRLTKALGDTVRRPIPAFLGDANAIANTVTGQDKSLTKATNDEGKTDYIGTEVNRTIAKLGLDSLLPRDTGKSSQNVIDRVTGGTHATSDTQAAGQERDVKKSLKQMEAELKKDKVPLTDEDIKGSLEDGDYQKARRGLEYQLAKAEADGESEAKKNKIRDKITQADLQGQGVPVTKDGIEARAEDGDYESAIKGAEYQLQTIQNDKNVPKSKKQDAQDEVTRLKVTRDGDFPPALRSLYFGEGEDGINLSEWRALGDPDSEDYDPDLYEALWAYDEALAKNGVSDSTKDRAKQKFSAPKGRGAGGRGGGGGRGGKTPGFTTDIATQSFEGDKSFSPIKAVAANFATPASAIPVIAPVPNNDPSKLKKITVKKGGRS